jgi:hypothetical protein
MAARASSSARRWRGRHGRAPIRSGAPSRYLRDLLFGVEVHDVTTFGAVAGLLVVVALVAAWIPARVAPGVGAGELMRSE